MSVGLFPDGGAPLVGCEECLLLDGSGAASGIASLPLVLIQTGVLWAGVACTYGFTQPDQGLHAKWNRRHPGTRYTAYRLDRRRIPWRSWGCFRQRYAGGLF